MTTDNTPLTQNQLMHAAVRLAESWQNRANELLTNEEKRIQARLKRLLTRPMDKIVLTQMIDQSFRSQKTGRVANQLHYVLKTQGVPKFFSLPEKGLIRLFMDIGRHLPMISVPQIIDHIRKDSSRAIVPGEESTLFAHLEKRKDEGVRMNINHLGEAVLGEEEALYHLSTYLDDLKKPEIEYISVKISTIYSQISSLAFDHTLSVLKKRLTELFQTAQSHTFTRQDGTRVPKFVNLDMEEYRDLEITAAAFTAVLDQPEFKTHSAGIVLQAYLPDSFPMQQKLTEWAVKRVADGGAPIKIRVVKGANMEMEMVESSIFNWPLAPYDNKPDVDANFKRMVTYGMTPERMAAVHLGIASHNLFEQAYAYELARSQGLLEYHSFEMLEGMADHVRRAIQEVSGDILLYAPVAGKDQFINAIAYLIRRLDENTAPDNFLRYAPDLKVGSHEWTHLKDEFLKAIELMDGVKAGANRIQDRNTESFTEKAGTFASNRFTNEADTDWSLTQNRIWAESIRANWKKDAESEPMVIPSVVAGEEITSDRNMRSCIDPNQASGDNTVTVADIAMASIEDADKAVAVAKEDPDGWRSLSYAERHRIITSAALNLRDRRGDLIGAASATTGKVITETDPEVSEAIDFAEFYPWTAQTISDLPNISATGKGVGLVISPWNFPVAIPCGGVVAALAAGNTVIFKPSSDAVLPAWILCNCFWDAGVSKNTLQFMPCSGGSTGNHLANHPDVDFIILTGGTDTGLSLLKQRPDVFLAAETGGKNATIVTSMSDRDQAIKNVIYSAFGNTGQKCSATSLLILEKDVFADEKFKKQLKDAAESWAVGSAWDFENKMGPLVKPPSGDLKRGLTELAPGESWLLEPRNINNNPYLWTPGIRWGVSAGSDAHLTEYFGPVLSVMSADNIEHAIDLVNQTGYGLTSGLESLDTREQAIWQKRIKAGNLYINRGTTGAVVLRQPFGGMGKSAIGAGIKAGGLNYVTQLMDIADTSLPPVGAIHSESPMLAMAHAWSQAANWGMSPDELPEMEKTTRAIESYLYNFEQHFKDDRDFFHLRGQDNIIRYLPVGHVVIRCHEDDSAFDIIARIAASKISGCQTTLSIPSGLTHKSLPVILSHPNFRPLMDGVTVTYQTDSELAAMIPVIQRIRYAAPDRVPAPLLEKAAETGFYIARQPVLMEGRIELIHYFVEQSICNTFHRYGNLGTRQLNIS